ncbi:hypothetical protein Tco_0650758 [Tanacetum coccineum]
MISNARTRVLLWVESPGMDDEGYGLDDEGHGRDDRSHIIDGQGSGLALVSERPKRVSAFRQPTLTTWTDPEDDMIYIDIPDYPPPTSPVQTPPSPEWTSGSLPISPSPSDDPSPISSPMTPLTVPSPVATPNRLSKLRFLQKFGLKFRRQQGLI